MERPARALAVYRAEADRSRSAGFPSTRLAIEMSGAMQALGSVETTARWEAVLGPVLLDLGFTTVCQYEVAGLRDGDLELLAGRHAALAVDDGTMPAATFTAGHAPHRLCVAGEIDLTNAEQFARALRARAEVSPIVEVELDGVTFVDVTATRMIFEVARALPRECQLVLRRPPALMVRLLALAGWHDPRVKVEAT